MYLADEGQVASLKNLILDIALLLMRSGLQGTSGYPALTHSGRVAEFPTESCSEKMYVKPPSQRCQHSKEFPKEKSSRRKNPKLPSTEPPETLEVCSG